MVLEIKDEYGDQALDIQQLLDIVRGNAVISGCSPSTGSGDMEVDIASGSVVVAGSETSVSSQTATIPTADANNPRKDIIYIDSAGNAQVSSGTPESAQPEGNTGRNTYQPQPNDLSGTDGAVVAEVYVPAQATSISASNISDRRLVSDFKVGNLEILNDPTDAQDAATKSYVDTETAEIEVQDDGATVEADTMLFDFAGDFFNVSSSSSGEVGIQLNESGISHDNIADVSADDHHTRYSDEEAQDAVGNAVTVSGALTYTYNDGGNQLEFATTNTDDLSEGASNLYFTDERAQDAAWTIASGGTDVSVTYDDAGNTATIDLTGLTQFSTDDLSEGSNLYFTDERVDDRVNTLLSGGSNITLSYDDANDTLTIDATDTDTRVETQAGGTTQYSDTEIINFDQNLQITDNGSGSITVDAAASTDTRTDISDSGGVVQAETEDVTFTASNAATVSVTADGDGTATVDISATDTTYTAGTGLNLSSGTFSLDESYAATWTSKHTFNAGLDAGSSAITSVADPSDAQDAATKNYVDNNSGSGGSGGITATQQNTVIQNEDSVTLTRFTVPSGKSLEVYKGSVADDSGNHVAGMELEIFNHTDGTTEYVIANNTVQEGSPLYSGSTGDDVEIRLVNATGSQKTMTGQMLFDVV